MGKHEHEDFDTNNDTVFAPSTPSKTESDEKSKTLMSETPKTNNMTQTTEEHHNDVEDIQQHHEPPTFNGVSIHETRGLENNTHHDIHDNNNNDNNNDTDNRIQSKEEEDKEQHNESVKVTEQSKDFDDEPSEEYQNQDEYPESTPAEGFSTDSLLQVMSEEVSADDLEDELIMDDSLTPMERIYMFNKSDMIIHRLLVAKELSNTIYEISVSEAVNYVLPMVLKICADPDDTVRETIISEFDKIIMYYYTHAQPILDSAKGERRSSTQLSENTEEQQEDEEKDVQNPAEPASLHSQHEELDTISVPAPAVDTPTDESIEHPMDADFVDGKKAETQEQAMDHSSSHDDNEEIGEDEENENQKVSATVTESPNRSRRQSGSFDNDEQQQGEEGEEEGEEKGREDESSSTKPITSEDSSLHIPQHVFAPLLIEFLLDQNSSLASLAQQCIVSVATELAAGKGTEDEELYRKLLDVEIFEGVVLGLMSIVGKSRQLENDQSQDGSGNQDGVYDEASGFMNHHPSADEVDQGEINLAKMMCLSLISALANVLGPERCTERCLPLVESMANDGMFYVRKEAAAAIGSLATVVDPQVAMERLMPLYLNYSRDTIWHVRRSCVLTLPLLCGVLPEDVKDRIAVEGVKLFKNDVSRNVRNTLAEIIGELIAKFLPEDWETTGKPGKVPEPLLEFFLSLGPSASANQMYKLETDRAIICAYNFPAVVLTAGADYWDSHLKDTYLNLTKDYQIKVRRTFAYSLHEIARIIGPERTERDLVQIFALYLMDLDDVKQGVLEHLAEFLGTLAVSSRNEYIPILAEVWDGVMTNWRLRDILAGQLRDIALLFDAARVVEHILPLAIRACQDEFAAVRETGVESFPIILDTVKRAVDEDGETLSQADQDNEDGVDSCREFALALLNHVMEKLDEFVRSNSYRGRLIFVQICKVLLEAGICAADFASFFLPRLVPLADDPVVNVRIATSRTIRAIQIHDTYRQELTELVLSDMIGEHDTQPGYTLDHALYHLALDRDPDVRSFVMDLVDHQRLEHERQLREQQQAENAGTPMQGIEVSHEASSPGGSTAESHYGDEKQALHNATIAEEVRHSDHEDEDEDEEQMTSAGTPMDCTVEGDEENEKREHEVYTKHEDEDETMMDVEKNEGEDQHHDNGSHHPQQHEDDHQPPITQESHQQQTPSSPTHHQEQTSTDLADDKEKDEYVYLSKSMVHQDDSPQSTPTSTTTAITSQSQQQQQEQSKESV
ncbi:armadillo-type protein [Phascolomyces articulosus]|uniref:Armadillo-type protein n=1 Tax=Phascolomyces articulosus TaxID=60185 RepID=A0AAD5PIY5_9FUNG|nr:armadillo-type protein [Phascolomyces articulosus]